MVFWVVNVLLRCWYEAGIEYICNGDDIARVNKICGASGAIKVGRSEIRNDKLELHQEERAVRFLTSTRVLQ